jgi:hypothetical protein
VYEHGRFQLHVSTPERQRLIDAVYQRYPAAECLRIALFKALVHWWKMPYDVQPETRAMKANIRRLQRRLDEARMMLRDEGDPDTRSRTFRAAFFEHFVDFMALTRDVARQWGIPFSPEEDAFLKERSWLPDEGMDRASDPTSSGITSKRSRDSLEDWRGPQRLTVRGLTKDYLPILEKLIERLPREPSVSSAFFAMLRQWVHVKDDRPMPALDILAPSFVWGVPLELRAARRAMRGEDDPNVRAAVYSATLQRLWDSYVGCCINQEASVGALRCGLDLTDEEEEALQSMEVAVPISGDAQGRVDALLDRARSLYLKANRASMRKQHPEDSAHLREVIQKIRAEKRRRANQGR